MVERRQIKNADLATASSGSSVSEPQTGNGGAPPTLAAVEAEIEVALAAGELSLQDKFDLFERRLKAALTDNTATTTSITLEKLLRETDNAIAAAQQEALDARERGLDFVATPDAKTAREAIDDAEFFVSRLLTQRPRLAALLNSRLQQEKRVQYFARYEELKQEGAALGAELAEIYPGLVGPLVDLFVRLRAFQQKCRALHVTDPGGLPHVTDPELKARRLDGFTRDTPSLLESVHLHDWQSGREVWPPPSNFAATFVQSMGVPMHPGAAWSEPEFQARLAAEQQQQRERMAAHYATQAAEQLERENCTLRENWEASQRRG